MNVSCILDNIENLHQTHELQLRLRNKFLVKDVIDEVINFVLEEKAVFVICTINSIVLNITINSNPISVYEEYLQQLNKKVLVV